MGGLNLLSKSVFISGAWNVIVKQLTLDAPKIQLSAPPTPTNFQIASLSGRMHSFSRIKGRESPSSALWSWSLLSSRWLNSAFQEICHFKIFGSRLTCLSTANIWYMVEGALFTSNKFCMISLIFWRDFRSLHRPQWSDRAGNAREDARVHSGRWTWSDILQISQSQTLSGSEIDRWLNLASSKICESWSTQLLWQTTLWWQVFFNRMCQKCQFYSLKSKFLVKFSQCDKFLVFQ